MRAKEKHKHTKNDKEKGTGIKKYTGRKKIDEGHSIERVWHSASRELEGKKSLSCKYSVCVVCCHPIYSGCQVCGRTSRGHTGFLNLPSAVLALIFITRRIQPFLSLVDREV